MFVWRVLFHSSDDIDHRSSHTNIAQASSVPFAPPQMPVSASMPWLGSGQTSMGASVVRFCLLQTQIYTIAAKPESIGCVVLSDGQQGETKLCFRACRQQSISLCSLIL